MHVLILDTSTEYAIVGLCDSNGNVISSQVQAHERQLSVRLYSMIEHVLDEAKIDRIMLDAFSVGLGPGSFTGVRVAVTTMRTLAQVMNKPLYAFGTLEAMAASAVLSYVERESNPILALLPSRRDEVYAEGFAAGQSLEMSKAVPYSLSRTIFESMGEDAIAAGPESLLKTLFPEIEPSRLVAIEYPSLSAIATLTATEIAANHTRDPLSLDPMYVAPPAVSQHKQKTLGI